MSAIVIIGGRIKMDISVLIKYYAAFEILLE